MNPVTNPVTLEGLHARLVPLSHEQQIWSAVRVHLDHQLDKSRA